MWFKYFNKKNWNLRLWRGYNLKFDSNEFGLSSNIYLAQLQAFIMRISRTEATIRAVNLILFLGGVKVYSYLSVEDPKIVAERESKIAEKESKELEEERKIFKETLFLNRYEVPTKPTRSIEDLIEFTGYKTAMDEAINYMSLKESVKTVGDFQQGLDTWLGEEDQKLMLYAKEFKSSGH